MIKIKIFHREVDVPTWLNDNQDIDIISTNLACSICEHSSMWSYIIMYKTKKML